MSFAHWKTTVNGFLAAFIGTVGPVTAYLATIDSPKAATICGILTLTAAIARVWVGLLQNDAPTEAEIGGIAVNAVNTGVAPTKQ